MSTAQYFYTDESPPSSSPAENDNTFCIFTADIICQHLLELEMDIRNNPHPGLITEILKYENTVKAVKFAVAYFASFVLLNYAGLEVQSSYLGYYIDIKEENLLTASRAAAFAVVLTVALTAVPTAGPIVVRTLTESTCPVACTVVSVSQTVKNNGGKRSTTMPRTRFPTLLMPLIVGNVINAVLPFPALLHLYKAVHASTSVPTESTGAVPSARLVVPEAGQKAEKCLVVGVAYYYFYTTSPISSLTESDPLGISPLSGGQYGIHEMPVGQSGWTGWD
ncbi:hypothetical protein BDK51DRAFT_41469 [Blyttiomyces helicus]|uniref:Uncharacterized protein n=1 Tax=Blyttiomyces helicus TaxID=388810 RepID=A0A4P9WNH7_9FUNG|nr:hypothetical protein BDK51DRAFT_41469 [Blyttiomyces helicus]|eukprot:RKO92750.1 hypothetical protein BDK51DRAFT_41469 [Blyttiomyces helicus]